MAQPAATEVTPTALSGAPSRTGSTASRAAADPVWMAHVGWDGKFHLFHDVPCGQRHEADNLKKIVEKSFIVPAWMANIESPEWAVCNKLRLRDSASDISSKVSRPQFAKDKDDEMLSFDVQESLASILHIPRHAASLESHRLALEPMESDRRHPVDTLGSLVWDVQSEERVVYRTERKLAIPRGEVQPDACAFIPLSTSSVFGGALGGARAALSCFPSTFSSTSNHRYVLHWVTEYKRDQDELDSKHQVAEGLVSALYQRRAYGFPDHFVFGSAHYNRTVIEVIAATWVRSDEPAGPGARSQEAKTTSAVPAEDQKTNPPGNLLQESDTTNGPPKAGEEAMVANTSVKIEDVKKYNKIVMYSIAMYDMAAAADMLQLYLLMRHTLTLARQYKDEMAGDECARVRELKKEAKELYEWSPPPRAPSNRGTKRHHSGASKYSPSLASMSEDKGNDMSIDPYDDSDYSSDSEVLEPPNAAGPERRIVGEVGSYTLRDYAYEEDAEV
ncbi:hypothetical protein V565_111410 [Rhizoctonia solani 123E]|uniref:Uncharacterized protein n=1 Tax=Rhizoctonia solani 123E TaxID=1423351 RepID=A0A074RQ13_9AGAM|nr:hypothetical protein V565_111410 [Rhizoctonia solani 123E]